MLLLGRMVYAQAVSSWLVLRWLLFGLWYFCTTCILWRSLCKGLALDGRGLAARSWPSSRGFVPIRVSRSYFACLGAKRLTILSLGDETAKGLGP